MASDLSRPSSSRPVGRHDDATVIADDRPFALHAARRATPSRLSVKKPRLGDIDGLGRAPVAPAEIGRHHRDW
jgi:hypothetical protein